MLLTGVTKPEYDEALAEESVALRFLSSTVDVNVRFVEFFPTEFLRERLGDVSAEVEFELFLLAILDFLAEVRVGAVSFAGVALVEFPPPRLRFLITSVLRERGRTTPWSLRNNPQALHRGWPSGFRRHRGVLVV